MRTRGREGQKFVKLCRRHKWKAPKVVLQLSAGTRVILEFIPNHTSNESDWFVKSVARDPCCEDFYVWRDANGTDDDGDPIPPNDWVG